jgi:hypothetical protein
MSILPSLFFSFSLPSHLTNLLLSSLLNPSLLLLPSQIDSTGANCPEFINAMKFSSIWRMITGERGNLFKEMQMYKRYVTARTVLSIYSELKIVAFFIYFIIDMILILPISFHLSCFLFFPLLSSHFLFSPLLSSSLHSSLLSFLVSMFPTGAPYLN